MQRAIPANVGYKGFPATICTSVNNVICHGIPSEAKVLKDGDIINIDVTVIKDGFHGDTSRMYVVGKPVGDRQAPGRRDPRGDVPRHPGGQARARPWATSAMRSSNYAEGERFSVVREYCGHGIGRIYHEDPQVLHYGKPGDGLRACRRA